MNFSLCANFDDSARLFFRYSHPSFGLAAPSICGWLAESGESYRLPRQYRKRQCLRIEYCRQFPKCHSVTRWAHRQRSNDSTQLNVTRHQSESFQMKNTNLNFSKTFISINFIHSMREISFILAFSTRSRQVWGSQGNRWFFGKTFDKDAKYCLLNVNISLSFSWNIVLSNRKEIGNINFNIRNSIFIRISVCLINTQTEKTFQIYYVCDILSCNYLAIGKSFDFAVVGKGGSGLWMEA